MDTLLETGYEGLHLVAPIAADKNEALPGYESCRSPPCLSRNGVFRPHQFNEVVRASADNASTQPLSDAESC